MIELSVKDMTCGHCVGVVRQAGKTLDPNARIEVDLEDRRVRVEGRSGGGELVRALGAAGYSAVVAGTKASAAVPQRAAAAVAVEWRAENTVISQREQQQCFDKGLRATI